MNKKFDDYILTPLCQNLNNGSRSNAFYIADTFYTYQQLSQRISAIRGVIRDAAIDENIWALHLHDDLNTYASICALWMEGKAYVPLHPNWPQERLDSILEQIGCHNQLDSCNAPYTKDFLDDWKETSEDALAYILFTSGSTGKPKGVPLSRKNLAAFVEAFWDEGYQISSNDRCLQCFDLTFDLSIMSYLVPLLKGACVYTIPYDAVKCTYTVKLLDEQKLTVALMTPSTIQYLQPYFDEFEFPDMRYSLFCGEALPTEAAMGWARCVPNAEIHNVYGPTEDTIFCTTYKLNRVGGNVEHNGVLSIGKTMTSGKIIIVDDNNQIVKGSEIGELCLSGDQLTQGYWKNPEKDKEVFWYAQDGTRYYRSGDLCYYGADGNVLFVGRKDSQVKIQGYRIELGEIECHVRDFFNNEKRIVVLAHDIHGMTQIILFVESETMNTEPLLAYLNSKMPSYMLPAKIIFVPNFPINSSSKIDRTSLKKRIQ